MWNSFVGTFRQGAREGIIDYNYLDNEEERPTHVFDIYKNRRGRLKDVRIWSRLDLGTGERKDLFITTANNIPIKIPNNEVFQTRSEIINWRDMLQKGIED